jgi:hypothetical protein
VVLNSKEAQDKHRTLTKAGFQRSYSYDLGIHLDGTCVSGIEIVKNSCKQLLALIHHRRTGNRKQFNRRDRWRRL